MEERELKVTLKQAVEWYNSGNKTLKNLALTVFSEEELILNMETIMNKVSVCDYSLLLPISEKRRFYALADFALVAKYFNGSWKKTADNTGYFIGQSVQGFGTPTRLKDVNLPKNMGIIKHNVVMYPGIIYFKRKNIRLILNSYYGKTS
mgnify:CR=1 FL=1